MSGDYLSPDASLNYYTYHLNEGNNSGNENSTSTTQLPAIIQVHQGLYSNDVTIAESRKWELSAKDFIIVGEHKAGKDFHLNLKKSPSDSTAANCALDLRFPVFSQSQIVKTARIYYGKHTSGPIPNFYDVGYAADVSDHGVPCSVVDICTQDSSQLFYRVFYATHDYAPVATPIVVIFHAGGFSDCSGPNYLDTLAIMTAQRGFIVVVAEYRCGRIKDTRDAPDYSYTSVQQVNAIYRSVQDGRGLLRTVIKTVRTDVNHDLPYLMDTSNIFLAGQSAGGVIAMSLAYDKYPAQAYATFPSPTDSTTIDQALGPIDADYYDGETSIQYYPKIKGLWSMWGAKAIPLAYDGNEADFFQYSNRTPMIAFMGDKDPVFPKAIAGQYVYYSGKNHPFYNSTSNCLIPPFRYTLDQKKKIADLRMECTLSIYDVLTGMGIPALMYVDCQMGHGLLPDDNDPNTPYYSNFGLPLSSNEKAVNEYMVSRAAIFFQAILNNTVSAMVASGPSKFVECEDFRHSSGVCSTAADYCNNNGSCD